MLMKSLLSFIALIAAAAGVLAQEQQYLDRVHSMLLPPDFSVYVHGDGVVNHPAPGHKEKKLPTLNLFAGAPGCYLACYTKDKQNSVYSVGGGIYVAGQVRVPGKYVNRVCRPSGFETADVSAEQKFKDLCRKIQGCKDCWAGGDTGGWFGIQEDGSTNASDCSREVQQALTR